MARVWSRQLAAIGSAVLLVGVFTGPLVAYLALPVDEIGASLAVLTVAVTAMIAILVYVAGRIGGDRGLVWLAPLAGGYGLMTMVATLRGDRGWPRGATSWLQHYLALPVAGVGLFYGIALAYLGWIVRGWVFHRVGLGITVVGGAHVYQAVSMAGDGGVTFSGLRLLGALLVLAAVVRCVVGAIQALGLEQSEQLAELRLAQLDLRNAAERDHEVRNAMAGLAGAASLMDGYEPEAARLRTAMAAELTRLNAMMHGHAWDGPAFTGYRVLPVLRQQVTLRRSAGMDITLDSELGLGAVGTPTVLAHVLCNVLSNCAAHAAGSPVRIEAHRNGGSVLIRVADLGPGVAVEPGYDVFDPGVRGAQSSGQGLGLGISRRLLAAEGGAISIRPRSVTQPGCTVLIELPAAMSSSEPQLSDLAMLEKV